MSRLGEHARHTLTAREQERLDAHVAGCARCDAVAMEVEEVGSGLAVVLLPLVLGTTVGGALLASLAPAQPAAALALPPVPPVLESIAAAHAGTAAIGATATAVTATASAPILAGALAVTVVLGGGIAAVLQPTEPPPSAAQSIASSVGPGAAPVAPAESGAPGGDGGGVSVPGANIADAPAGGADAVDGLVGGLVGDVTDGVGGLVPELPVGPVPEHSAPDGLVGALVDLDLNGTGMPGATVSAQVAGQIYTTVVASNGTWALRLTALPEGVGPIKLKQNLKVLGITVPIDIPLKLLSDTLGVTVELLN
jgi:hypothetical protein